MTETLSRWLIGHRALGWLIFCGLTAASGAGLFRLTFDDDLRSTFRDDSIAGRLMAENFPASDNTFMILVRGADLFSPEIVSHLREFDFSLREIDGIDRVASIFDLRSLHDEDGYLPPLMPGPDDPPARFVAAKHETLRHPLARNVVVSASGGSFLFLADPTPNLQQVDDLVPVQAEIHQRVAELADAAGLDVTVSGVPALRIQIIEASRREQLFYTVAGGVLGTLIAWLVFRSLAVTLITLPVPLVAAGWAVGALGLAGEPVNPMNNMINALVMIIALTDSIHLTFGIRRHVAAGESPRQATINGLIEVGPACFLTSFTTAIAFASLALSSNEVVTRFGIACAVGTMLVFLAVALYIPLVASTRIGAFILPPSSAKRWPIHLWFSGIADFVVRFRRPVTIASFAIALLSGWLCLDMKSDYRYRENFDHCSPHWRAIQAIDAEFGGSQPLRILISLDPEEPAHHASLLSVLPDLHAELLDSGYTGRPISLLNLIQATGLEDADDPLAKLAEVVPEEALAAVYQPGHHLALVTAPLPDLGSHALTPILNEIELRLKNVEARHPGVGLALTGLAVVSVRSSQSMIREMGVSLLVAAIGVFLVIGVSMRSLSLGLRSVIPNLLPMGITAAGLVIFDQPMQYISAMVLTICLGVAVDDTIHYLFRYRGNLRRGMAPEDSIREAGATVGTALLTSTAILVAGFSLLQISEMPTVRTFSWLGMITLVTALVADLICLPALLLVTRHHHPSSSASHSLP